MATINKNGTNGTNGTNGATPTKGGNGTDGIYTQNGVNNGSLTDMTIVNANGGVVNATGGNGGLGGNGNGTGVPGADGGNGGNGAITFNGNIFNAPTATTVQVKLNATGGDGGIGGSGTTPGHQGVGGNATVQANGNIFQPKAALTTLEFDAFANAGAGSVQGNASSTINGNIFQSSKLTGTVTLDALANGLGTNTATLNGNIVQGNTNNVNLYADAIHSGNGTSNINGNVITTNATNTGNVVVEANANHIAITQNKFTLGKQELDIVLNEFGPFDATFSGNTLKGTGANTLVLDDLANGGTHKDIANVNLATGTFTFDGQANSISGFENVTVAGNGVTATLVGDGTNNALTGGDGDDFLTGGGGNDTLNGGAGTDTAIYSGNFAQYTVAVGPNGNGTVTDNTASRDGTDMLISIEKIQFADGTYNTGTGVFTGPNHAPVLDASKSPVLMAEAPNAPAPVGAVGTLVSSLVDLTTPPGGLDNVTDTDTGAVTGIALTNTDTANGSWFYSTNNGTSWTAVGTVSDASALLLAADANTRLYFQPAAGYTGTDPSAITFRAWDQTSGANGTTANVTTNGGATAFSTATDTASLTINPLNHAPVAADDSFSVNEDASLTVGGLGVLANDTDPDAGDTLAAGVVSGPAHGSLVFNPNGTFTYTPTANYNGADSFTYQDTDNHGATSNTATVSLNVRSVNDAPIGTNNTVTTLEDTAYTFSQSDFGFSDPNDSPANSLKAVEITTLPSAGTLTDNGVAVTAGQFVSAADITGGLLKFTPATNANGTGYSSFTFQVQDNGGTARGGVDTDPNAKTMTVNVTSVNDAPVGAGNTVTTLEDTAYTFSSTDFSFSDPMDNPPNTLKAVEITTLPTAGTLTDNGVAVTAGQFVSAADINGGLLKFTPAANANGTGYAAFTFQVQDNGGTANGGIDTDPVAKTMTVNVTSVNDAPAGTDTTINSNENTAYIFGVSDFGFTDPNDSPANTLQAVEITTLPAHGTLLNNGVAVTAGQFVSAADIAAGHLIFAPAPNTSGAGYGTFTFQVQDNGGTANGGIDTDPTPNILTLNVVHVNHAPVLDAAKTPVLATEGKNAGTPVGAVGTLVSSLVDLNPPAGGIDNVTDSDAGAVTGIALTATNTTNGSWYYSTDNGANWTAVGTVSNASALLLAADANTRVYFQPGANFSGAVSPAVTFRAWDQTSGTAGTKVDTTTNGGTTAFSTATDTADVTIDPVRIGNTYYATINQALAAAQTGDTIYVQPGTYDESLLVNKTVNIVGVGPAGSVIINGTFAQDNNIPAGESVADWLKTQTQQNGGYHGDTGVTINADNVGLSNITVQNFMYDVGTQNNAERATAGFTNSVTNLTLSNVGLQDAVNGFTKDDGTTLNGLTISGGQVTDALIGVGLFNDVPTAGDATNTTIDGTSFSNILEKGIYTETAQGQTSFNNLTMNDVGNYGGVPTNGANGLNGNGIDVNLKFHTFVGEIDMVNDSLTNTGNSGGQNGAIVVEGRDDPGHPVYGVTPADTSGLAVNITGGTIDGSTTGVRVGELNKADPSLNVTGPAVTVDGTVITNTPNGQIDNHSQSQLTVIGGAGDDTYISGQTPVSTGPLAMYGNGGNDTLTGGLGDDFLQGGAGDDILDGGTGGTNTADYSDATSNGLVVSLITGSSMGGGDGNDTLYNIQNLNGSQYNDTLIGDDGDNVLNGGDGNDILWGHGGNNTLIGGAGTDTAYYSGQETSYTVTDSGFGSTSVFGGAEGVSDAFSNSDVERMKFLAPSHVADFNNDGVSDLVTEDNTGVVSVNGTPIAGLPSTLSVVGFGTFNPDANFNPLDNRASDFLLQDSTDGSLIVLTTNGIAAGFSGAALNANNYGANWKAIATGDFNGDASADVLLQNQATKAVEIMTVKANSTDAVGTVNSVDAVAAPGAGWNPIATGDFNGDGKSDILWQNTTTKQVEIYEMSGSTVTNTPVAQNAAGLTAVGTGDFNGDGFSDVLFKNASGQAVIWYMYGDTHTGTKTIAKPSSTSTLAGVADVDGNGNSDLLWTDTSGNVTATRMGGPSTLASSTVLGNVSLGNIGANTHLIASTGGG